MNWEAIGVIVAIVVAAVGGLGAFFTNKAKTDQHDSRLDAVDKKVDEASAKALTSQGELAAYKLHVAETYVSKTSLGDTETRLTKRIETVEHTVRNSTSQILGVLSGRAARNAE